MTSFQNARRSRLGQTCEWILEAKEYVDWKDGSSTSNGLPEHRPQETAVDCENYRSANVQKNLIIRGAYILLSSDQTLRQGLARQFFPL